MELFGRRERAIDQRLRNAVIGKEAEADAFAAGARAELGRRALQRTRLAGEIGPEIEHRYA